MTLLNTQVPSPVLAWPLRSQPQSTSCRAMTSASAPLSAVMIWLSLYLHQPGHHAHKELPLSGSTAEPNTPSFDVPLQDTQGGLVRL